MNFPSQSLQFLQYLLALDQILPRTISRYHSFYWDLKKRQCQNLEIRIHSIYFQFSFINSFTWFCTESYVIRNCSLARSGLILYYQGYFKDNCPLLKCNIKSNHITLLRICGNRFFK